MTNLMNLSDFGLLNINRKIIDSRKYTENLISIAGSALIINGTASAFDKYSYLYKSNLSLSGEITVDIRGLYIPSENPQTLWTLEGSSQNFSLKFTSSEFYLLLGTEKVIKFMSATIKDNSEVRAITSISDSEISLLININDRVYQKSVKLENSIDTTTFSKIYLGNDPNDTDTFWDGNIELQNFSILQDKNLVYTPSTNYPITFTRVLVSDGEFPLSDTSTPLTDHIIEFPVDEVSRSGNTILLTSQLGDETKMVIKEVALYAETDEGEILFSVIKDLNIDKGADLTYDLIFTVNIEMSVVNIVGFPDVVVKEPPFVPLKDFNTVKLLVLYICTNLERIVSLNATNIGYNRAQVFYKLQQEIEQMEDCYSTIQTYAKLVKRIHKVVETVFNPSLLTIYGTPEITEEGEISGFSTEDYASANLNFDSANEWELKSAIEVPNYDLTSQTNWSGIATNRRFVVLQKRIYVAITETGYTAISEDGLTWTTPKYNYSLGNKTWYAITFGDNKFVAISSGGYTSTSTDGINWTEATQNDNLGNNYWRSVTYGYDKFVALGKNGYISISTDGINWTEATRNSNLGYHNWIGITYNLMSHYVVLGQSGYISTSQDGINWTVAAQNTTLGDKTWRTLISFGYNLVATSTTGYLAFKTDNSETWTRPYTNEVLISTNCQALIVSDFSAFLGIGYYGQVFTLSNMNQYYVNATLHTGTEGTIETLNSPSVSQPLVLSTKKYPNSNAWNLVGNFNLAQTSNSDRGFATHGNNKCVLLTPDGYVCTSTDGEAWTAQRKLLSGTWKGITYGNGIFVAFGTSTSPAEYYTATSTDGETWKVHSAYSMSAVSYGKGRFVALSESGNVYTSTDGLSWTDHGYNSSLGNRYWSTIAFDGTKFVALGHYTYISTTTLDDTDGTNWNTATEDNTLNGGNPHILLYNDGKFLLYYNNSYIYTSTSGNIGTWTNEGRSEYTNDHAAIFYNGTSYESIVEYYIATSTDGITWDSNNRYRYEVRPRAMTFGNNKYIGITEVGYITTSTDGKAWITERKNRITPSGSYYWKDVTYGNNKFVALSAVGYISTSENGTTWTEPTRVSSDSGTWYSVIYTDNKFVVIGSKLIASGNAFFISTSTDGVNWTEPTEIQSLGTGSFPYATLTYGKGKFLFICSNGNNYLANISTSTDGINWTPFVQNTTLSNLIVQNAIFDGTKFVIAGRPRNESQRTFLSTSLDGLNWSSPKYFSNSSNYSVNMTPLLQVDDQLICISGGTLIETTSTIPCFNLQLSEVEKMTAEFDSEEIDFPRNTDDNLNTFNEYYTNTNSAVTIDASYTATDFNNSTLEVPIETTTFNSSLVESLTFTTPRASLEDASISIQTTEAGYGITLNTYANGDNPSLSVEYSGASTWSYWSNPLVTSKYFRCLTYGNNKFVALSETGYGSISTDGRVWSSLDTFVENHDWRTLTFGNDKFIALGYHGHIATSNNGETWTYLGVDSTLSSYIPSSITCGILDELETFVTLTWNGDIFTSTTGELGTWNQLQSISESDWASLTYFNNKFIAINKNGSVITSTDCTEWNQTANLGKAFSYALTSFNNQLVLLKTDTSIAEIYTSANGTNWTKKTSIQAIRQYLTSGNNTVVLMGGAYPHTSFTCLIPPSITSSALQPNTKYTLTATTTKNTDSSYTLSGLLSTSNDSANTESTTFTPENTLEVDDFELGGGLTYSLDLTQTSLTADGNPLINTSRTLQAWTTSEDIDEYNLHLDSSEAVVENPVISPSTESTEIVWNHPDINTETWRTNLQVRTGETLYYDIDDDSWYNLTYGNNKYVALSYSGHITTSIDGSTWTPPTLIPILSHRPGHSGLYLFWTSLTYGLVNNTPTYVALDEYGYIATSTDGTTWNEPIRQITTESDKCRSIIYDGEKFIALSFSGGIYTSTDTTTWNSLSQTTPLSTDLWFSFTYGNNTYVALGANGYIATSNDCSTWTVSSNSMLGGNYSWKDISYDGTNFIAISTDGYTAVSDSNLNTWSNPTEDPNLSKAYSNTNYWTSITAVNNKVIALSSKGLISEASYGLNWTSATQTPLALAENATWFALAFSGNSSKPYTAISTNGDVSQATSDFTWDTPTLNSKLHDGDRPWRALTYGNNKFVALSDDGFTNYSNNGTSWHDSAYSSRLQDLDWIALAYASINNTPTYVALSQYGHTSTSTDGITWTEVTTPTIPVLDSEGINTHGWRGLSYINNKFVAINCYGYIATSTDGETWTTPTQNSNLAKGGLGHAIAFVNNEYVALGYNGLVSTSTDMELWTFPSRESTLGANEWKNMTPAYGMMFALGIRGYSSMAYYTVTWSKPKSMFAQYIIGDTSTSANAAPFNLYINQNNRLTLETNNSYLYGWAATLIGQTIEGYTTTANPSPKDYLFSGDGTIIGYVTNYDVTNGTIDAYINSTSTVETFELAPSIDDEIPDTLLVCQKTLQPYALYNISASYNGNQYSLHYKLDPEQTSNYPTEETVTSYSLTPVSFNSNSSITWGSSKNMAKFTGNINFNNCYFVFDNYSWSALSRLSTLLTESVSSNSTNTLYDSDGYIIPEVIPHSISYGEILNKTLFEITPNTKNYFKVNYSKDDGGKYYSVSTSTNDKEYEEVMKEYSDKVINPVDDIYFGVKTTYTNDIMNPTISSPFNGTIYLKDTSVTTRGQTWSPSEEVVLQSAQILQYYHIPDYERSFYEIKDICDGTEEGSRDLTVLENTFTGNRDLIDFSTEEFSLCVKAWLKDSESKVLLTKIDTAGNPYLTLDFIDQTLKFTLYLQDGSTIELAKKLEIEDYVSYEHYPILISIVMSQDMGTYTFSMYKNNELIAQEEVGIGGLPIASDYSLTNYNLIATEETLASGTNIVYVHKEDPEAIYVQDILVINGALTKDELYYITNLTDTNY